MNNIIVTGIFKSLRISRSCAIFNKYYISRDSESDGLGLIQQQKNIHQLRQSCVIRQSRLKFGHMKPLNTLLQVMVNTVITQHLNMYKTRKLTKYRSEPSHKQCLAFFKIRKSPPSHFYSTINQHNTPTQNLKQSFIQLRHQLLTDRDYIPENHYNNLLLSSTTYEQGVSLRKLRQIMPELDDRYLFVREKILPKVIPTVVVILNEDRGKIETEEQMRSLVKQFQKPSKQQTLKFQGYLSMIKQCYPFRSILPSEYNKTVNYRMTLSKMIHTNTLVSSRNEKKMIKYNDIVGYLFFVICLGYVEMFPNLFGSIDAKNYEYFNTDVSTKHLDRGEQSKHAYKGEQSKFIKTYYLQNNNRHTIKEIGGHNRPRPKIFKYNSMSGFTTTKKQPKCVRFTDDSLKKKKRKIKQRKTENCYNAEDAPFIFFNLITQHRYQNPIRGKWLQNAHPPQHLISHFHQRVLTDF